MSAMRVLVTGVGGFVGFHLTKHLVERGDRVMGVGLQPAPPETAGLLAGEWRADVCDVRALEEALREAAPTAIVHLAAQSSAGQSFVQPVETYRANALGTFALLEAMKAASPGARLLVVGTGEVYGPQREGTRAREDAPISPISPYALSKATAEAAAEYYGRHGLDVVRTRSFGHFGPGQTDRFVIPSIARQIAEAEAGRAEPVVRVGNLDVTRDLTDVRDVAQAYRLLLERGERDAVYNVCRGKGASLAALATRLVEKAKSPVRLEPDRTRLRPSDIPYLVGDPGKIERATSWRATREVEQTLDEVLQEWRDRVA